MAATFKKPKAFNPTAARPAAATSKKMDLGFSDSDSPASASGSDSDTEAKGEKEETGGINFLEYVGLQKSLRRATEQKMELTDQLKTSREALRKCELALARVTNNNRTQLSLLHAAQRTQLEEKDRLIDNLKLTVEEITEHQAGGPEKAVGITQMADTINSLSAEKRDLFVKAGENELKAKSAVEELEEVRAECEKRVEDSKAELTEIRAKIDPVKLDAALNRGGEGGASSAEAEALRAEVTSLRDRIEIMSAQNAAASADKSDKGASSAQVQRLEAELKATKTELAARGAELKDANAKAAGLQAIAQSGGEAGKAAVAAQQALQEEASELKKQVRSLSSQVDDLQSALANEKAAHERTQAQLADLKLSLDTELKKVQGAAAAGDQAKKTIEQDLAGAKAELASEKSSHKAEQAAHETTRAQLADAKKSNGKLKEEMEAVKGDGVTQLDQERARHASAIQNAKAEAASELAVIKQRAADETKDLRQRMAKFSTVIAPMLKTIKEVSSNYAALRKEARDLQATVAPAVKQIKRDLLKALAEVDQQYKEMLTKYRKEMALRKKLHNEIVDLKGAIRVYGRIRPPISEDGKGPDAAICITPDPKDDQLCLVDTKGKVTSFELDSIFGPESTQQGVFDQVKDLICSVIDGFNVCIFAYGQTGSGKTFTMDGSTAQPGLNRRALRELFDLCEEKKVDWSYEIDVSVMEIYNENLRDLLYEPKSKKDKAEKLDIKHGKDGPFVPGLTQRPVRTVDDVNEAMVLAKSLRSTASTDMNELSSRSHMILIVSVVGTNLSTGVQTRGKLNLIDLAGSERVSKSGADQDEKRFKEATNINQSLSALGDVIHALGAKQKHIPYRNSKLTHLLQDSLGGSAKTLMLVQISPVVKNVSESVCSLNFAARVRAVELGAAKKTTESAEVAQLKKRIKELEAS